MRTLVTGATGFIGRALAAQLLFEGAGEVAILVRDAYRSAPLPPPLDGLRPDLITVYADLTDSQAARRAVLSVQPEVIVHLAAGGAGDPFLDVEAALEQNLYGTLNLLKSAYEEKRSPRPQRFIVVRTPGELSAMNPYAASKAAAWQVCAMYARTQGWPIVGAMPFQTYGPGQHTRHLVSGAMSAALAGEDFPLTAGEQRRDWVYISDVVDGLRAVRDAELPPGVTVDLGTGRLTTIADVVTEIYELTGSDGRPLIGALPSRPGEEAEQVADVARTRALIHWEAAVSLQEGLARYRDQLLRERH
jgi:UDP-glucose 4-epimerase